MSHLPPALPHIRRQPKPQPLRLTSNASKECAQTAAESLIWGSVFFFRPSAKPPARSETTASPSELALAPSVELAQEPPETTRSDAIPSPGPSPSHQVEHLGQCELNHNEPIQVPTTAQTDSSTETGKRIRKSHIFDLNMCVCGSEVSDAEIKEGDTVMRCKVPGCETEWVCKPHPCGVFYLLTSLFSVPLLHV